MHQFQVENMTCSHCAQTVERAVKSVDAGAKVSVDLASKAVKVEKNRSNRRGTISQIYIEKLAVRSLGPRIERSS